MKPDEKFAINNLEKHLGLQSPFFIDGNDPPDCIGHFCFQRIGVEITQIGATRIEPDGTATKREFDRPIFDWAVRAQTELQPLIPLNFTLFCHVKGPIQDFPKFKKTFPKIIQSLIDKAQIPAQTKEFVIGSAAVDLSLRPRNKPGLPVIITSGETIHNAPLQSSLDIQAGTSIYQAIQDKHQKCKKWKGRIWLLLINTHPILDHSDFDRLNKRMFRQTYFERIYMVDPQGSVSLIYQKRYQTLRFLVSLIGWCHSKFKKY